MLPHCVWFESSHLSSCLYWWTEDCAVLDRRQVARSEDQEISDDRLLGVEETVHRPSLRLERVREA